MGDVLWVTAFLDLPERTFERGAAFWSAVTGWPVSPRRGERREFATLEPPAGAVFLRLQAVGGMGGVHVDLHTADLPGLAARAEALGARRLSTSDDLVVLRSPGGLDFCLTSDETRGDRPAPATWPDGRRSLVDQVCIDIPAGRVDREVEFWQSLTGWEETRADEPFRRLVPPPATPVKLLLQRLGADDDGERVRAHLDIACDDKDGETDRHLALGATLVHREGEHWTTLRDPDGLAYCLTRRRPDTDPAT